MILNTCATLMTSLNSIESFSWREASEQIIAPSKTTKGSIQFENDEERDLY